MDTSEPSGSGEPRAKTAKLNNQRDEHVKDFADGAIVEQTADIFKLDIDCFEESLDYLRLKDLVSVG